MLKNLLFSHSRKAIRRSALLLLGVASALAQAHQGTSNTLPAVLLVTKASISEWGWNTNVPVQQRLFDSGGAVPSFDWNDRIDARQTVGLGRVFGFSQLQATGEYGKVQSRLTVQLGYEHFGGWPGVYADMQGRHAITLYIKGDYGTPYGYRASAASYYTPPAAGAALGYVAYANDWGFSGTESFPVRSQSGTDRTSIQYGPRIVYMGQVYTPTSTPNFHGGMHYGNSGPGYPPYTISGQFTLDFTAQAWRLQHPSVQILAAKMGNSHELLINVRRDFGTNRYEVEAKVRFGGETYTVPGQTRAANDSWVGDPEPIRFDFANASPHPLPRFSKNAKLNVELTVTDPTDGAESGDRANVAILLPVVLVPGLNNGTGGENSFIEFISEFRDRSDGRLTQAGLLGEGYRSLTDRTDYPTMYSVVYDTVGPVAAGAAQVKSYVEKALQLTWASKVNLVGYSKGGVVGRQFLVGPYEGADEGDKVAHFYICATPNVGALAAQFPRLESWGIGFGGDAQLIPVYPGFRKLETQRYLASANKTLTDLNERPLPTQGTRYTILYSDTTPTLSAFTLIGSSGLNARAPGDLVVPSFSAFGIVRDMNGVAPDSLIKAFSSAQQFFDSPIRVDAIHAKFMNKEAVIGPLFEKMFSPF